MARRSLNSLRESLSKLETPSETRHIPLSFLQLPARQPRHYFDPQKLEQLAASISTHGVLEPLLVRPLKNVDRYELVAGERRYRAAKMAQLTEVPVLIKDFSDEEAFQVSLVENLQREDLNPVEETEGILQLLAIKLGVALSDVSPLLHRVQHEKKKSSNNIVGNSDLEIIDTVFKDLGLMSWESFVNHRLPLLNLPNDVLEVLRQGKIEYTKAKAIARVTDFEQRQLLLKEAIIHNLSLMQIKERVASMRLGNISDDKTEALKTRMDATYRLVKKSDLWNDTRKVQKLEKLLAQIEGLIAPR